MPTLKFRTPGRTYTNDRIDPVLPEVPRAWAAERGYAYPENYVHLVSQFGGQAFDTENKVLRATDPAAKEGGFFELGILLHFNHEINFRKGGWLSVQSTYGYDETIYELGFVPFVNLPFRAWICFDFRADKANPSIVFYEGDISQDPEDLDEVISPVVDDFDAFLENLLPWEAMPGVPSPYRG